MMRMNLFTMKKKNQPTLILNETLFAHTILSDNSTLGVIPMDNSSKNNKLQAYGPLILLIFVLLIHFEQ